MDDVDFDDDELRIAFGDLLLAAIELVRRWQPVVHGRADRWEHDVRDLDSASNELAIAWKHEDAHGFRVAHLDITTILSDLLSDDDLHGDDP